jgi:flagellar biosynthesis regulator FlaF
METKREPIQSHEDREAQKLVKRIEKTQASQEAAREAETKRTLDDYGRKVGS